MSRRAAFAVILLGAAVCFAVALARALSVPLSSDIALQLHIAEALARGAQMGRDVIEVNPPLAAWLEVPVVRLATMMGVAAPFGHQVAVFLLGVLSVALVALAGSRLAALQPAWRLVAFSLSAALALALQAGLEVGQREQLAVLLTLPHFVLLAARVEEAPVSLGLAVVIGLAAGLGFALKPFFVLPLAIGEFILVRRRGVRVALGRPEVRVIVAAFVTYALAIVVVAPGWLESARAFWPLYGAYRPATLRDVVVQQGAVMSLSVLALIAWLVARRTADPASHLGDTLAAALIGFVIAMLAQRKPWAYLGVPSAVLSLTLLVAVAFETAGRVRSRAGRLARAVLVLGTSLRMSYHARSLVHAPAMSMADRTALVDYTNLRTALEALPPGTTIAALSPTHFVVFPLVPDLQARWTMRLPSLWPALSGGAQDVATQDRLRRLVAEDLEQRRPEVLLVLNPAKAYAWLGPLARRDWQEWLADLPEGAAALLPYRPWLTVGEFRVLRREPLVP